MRIANHIYYKFFLLLIGSLLLFSCKRVSIVVEDIPSNTPIGEPIYVVGNFNRWNPGDERYQMRLSRDSVYSFQVPAGLGLLKYKFTRGNWKTVEKGLCGDEIDDRSVFIDADMEIINTIESWADLDPVNCNQRTIKLDLLPINTPEDAEIAIASEINSWDPNINSLIKKNEQNEYFITVDKPQNRSSIEFKVTRGDLSTVETDVFGNELPNRILEFGKRDTLCISVESWIDMPIDHSNQIVLFLKSIPNNTPSFDDLYLASKMNSWKSGDIEYQFQKNEKGEFYIQLPRKNMILDYKITRDGWHTVEVDRYGNDIDNRSLNLRGSDTVFIEVINWKDQEFLGNGQVVIILDKLPETTPKDDDIFIAGNFNNWEPGKLKYRFKKKKDGRYYVNLIRRNDELRFKITRGNWEQEAINKTGNTIPEYVFDDRDFDTLVLKPDLKNWKDILPYPHLDHLTFVIDQLPQNTLENSKIFLASNINYWDPENNSFRFDQLPNGKFYLTVFKKNDALFEYKITRGGWGTVETDEFRNDIDNRIQYFGFADTVFISIESWKDLD